MLEVIEKRISRRNFKDIMLKEKDVKRLNTVIEEINTESGLNIEIEVDAKNAFKGLTKSYGLFHGVNSAIVLKGKTSEDLFEQVGYYGEKLVLEATKLGFGTCWVGGSFDHNFFNYYDEEVVCIVAIGYVTKKLSMREKLIHNVLHNSDHHNKENLKSTREITDMEQKAFEAIQLAPSAKNRKVIKLNFIDEEVVISTINDYHFDMVDLGIAKYHFELVTGDKFELGNNARLIKK